MSIEEKLGDLFDRWKAEQLRGKVDLGLDISWRFTPDGIVGEEEAYLNAPVKVLYILKEGNLTERADMPAEQAGRFDFWFKRIVATGEPHKIKRRIEDMQKIITGSDDLTVTAHMNLNKAGGLASTDMKKLRAYATAPGIAPLIREEIKLLAPDVIVCGGCYGIVAEILGADAPYRMVDMWHPSHRVTDAAYREKFKNEWEGQ